MSDRPQSFSLQTEIARNGPTYLKLSTLRSPSDIKEKAKGPLPTCKTVYPIFAERASTEFGDIPTSSQVTLSSVSTRGSIFSSVSNTTGWIMKYKYASHKIRNSPIKVHYYYSFSATPLTSPATKLIPEPQLNWLYLHHQSASDKSVPTIWRMTMMESGALKWVRVNRGCVLAIQNEDIRYLAISNSGKPSWNKKGKDNDTKEFGSEHQDTDNDD